MLLEIRTAVLAQVMMDPCFASVLKEFMFFGSARYNLGRRSKLCRAFPLFCVSLLQHIVVLAKCSCVCAQEIVLHVVRLCPDRERCENLVLTKWSDGFREKQMT